MNPTLASCQIMSHPEIFHEDYLRLVHCEESGYLTACWQGNLTKAAVREGCEQIIHAMQECRVGCLLNDNSDVTGNWLHSAEWVVRDWYPRARNSGLKFVAWVHGQNRLAHIPIATALALGEWLYGSAETQGVKTFDDPVAAIAWLRERSEYLKQSGL